jgi:serine/threonine-protein kinase
MRDTRDERRLDWTRVTELFTEARELTGEAARLAFLDRACGGDERLRTEVLGLLAADLTDGFLEALPDTLHDAGPREAAPLAAGQILNDRYAIDERFASGGQAIVYRATDRVLSRPVVVKVMRASGLQNAHLRGRFEREMRALSRIDHPSIVGILDVGQLEDGAPFLVIQYIDGSSLREVLADGPLERRRAAALLQAIGTGLGAAHAAGVAHHDLKPENVMVQRLAGGTESIKLIDFGISKIERADMHPAVTTVMVAGSVRYMAPEQFEGVNTPASDVYALGLLACELLWGRPDLRVIPPRVDRRVRGLLAAALAFDPADRPSDVRAWADALAACLLRPRRMSRLLAIGAAAAAIAAAVVLSPLLPGLGGEESRVVEKVGAFDPVVEGFQIHNDMAGTVVPNEDRTQLIGWSVTTSHPGGADYYHHLTNHQKRSALSRGWTLRAVLRVVEGSAFVLVDFAGYGNRYDINVNAEPDGNRALLGTQIVPSIEWFGTALHDSGRFHTYELVFRPSTKTADLWIDGEKRLEGYRGHNQFQEDRGVSFGAVRYKSTRGVAQFQSVRFEINP